MARTYADVQKEIESLQKTAEVLRQKEIASVIDRIKTAIAMYELTAADLGFGVRNARPAVKGRGPRKAAKGGAAVYSNGAGLTWSGRGRRPAWVNEALAAGKQLEDLRA